MWSLDALRYEEEKNEKLTEEVAQLRCELSRLAQRQRLDVIKDMIEIQKHKDCEAVLPKHMPSSIEQLEAFYDTQKLEIAKRKAEKLETINLIFQ